MYQMIGFLLLGGLLVSGLQYVSGININTTSEVEAVNGTDVKLKCNFRSSYPVSLTSVTVAWLFQPLDVGPEEMMFFYHKKPYPSIQGFFKDHVVWSGDVMEKDAAITLLQVSPAFNGTYSCQVRNMPDVLGTNGKVVLRVINKTTSFNPND